MNQPLFRRTLLLVLGLGVPAMGPGRASGETQAVTSADHGSVTVDASRLHSVIPLNATWRFSPVDDPVFASPSFDDSSWPLLKPTPEQRLAAAHVPDSSTGQCWARLHLHLLNATEPLAVVMSVRDGTQYAVLANGKEIGRSKGFSSGTKYFDRPFRLQLPAVQDIVLSVHFINPAHSVVQYFPLESVGIGQTQVVADRMGLRHYAEFEKNWFAYIALAAVYLACVPFSLILLSAQRSHVEYFWFAIFCLLSGASYAIVTAIFLAFLPYSNWIMDLDTFLGALEIIAGLEFAASLSGIRPVALRTVEAILLVSPVLFSCGAYKAQVFSDAISSILWLAMIVYLLGTAYRRGSKECGLLLVPFIVLQLSALLAQAQSASPSRFGEMWQGHFGGIGFRAPDVGALLIILAVLAIVLYRFIRVSNSEQLASSELEAARTVQQLLIPAVQPAAPGFSVESVYLPARQVGGDFFLTLPDVEASGNGRLLVIIGDVSGKGLQAAMVVSTIIGGLRMQLSFEPAAVLAHLNRMLVGHVSGFATCCATLIYSDGRMQIANAGNPAPYCDGEELDTLPGLPLGLVCDTVYEETVATLPAHSRLTFVSDGVIEATAAHTNELFGFDRTLAISRETAAVIAKAAVVFGDGAPQADDITVLTITRA